MMVVWMAMICCFQGLVFHPSIFIGTDFNNGKTLVNAFPTLEQIKFFSTAKIPNLILNLTSSDTN